MSTKKEKLKQLIENYVEAEADVEHHSANSDSGTIMRAERERTEAKKKLYDFIDTLDLSTMGDP